MQIFEGVVWSLQSVAHNGVSLYVENGLTRKNIYIKGIRGYFALVFGVTSRVKSTDSLNSL